MKKTTLFAAIIGIIVSAYTVQAADYTWTGSNDNNWSNTANWDANGLPPTNTYGVTGSGNRIIIQNGAYDPTNNVPTFDVKTATPKFVLEAGASLFTKMARDSGNYGPIGTGTIVSIDSGAELTWGRTGNNNMMELSRENNGIQSFNIKGTFSVTNCNRLDWGENQNRISNFNIDGGSFIFYGSQMFGTRFGNTNATWTYGASLVNLTNGASFIARKGYFEGNMVRDNNQPNLIFNLQSLDSKVVFKSSGGNLFSSINDVLTNGIGKYFISSTYGEDHMTCTEGDSVYTVKFGYYIWEGDSDNNWSNTANWVDCYLPPTSSGALKDSRRGGHDLIVIENGTYDPTINVPYASHYNDAQAPNITIKSGADFTLSFLDATVDGPVGEYTYTVESGGSFTLKTDNTNNRFSFARDPGGIQVTMNVSGDLIFDSVITDMRLGFNTNRVSNWNIDGGTVSFDAASGNIYGNNDNSGSFPSPSTLTLKNGGVFNATGFVIRNIFDNNGAGPNPTVKFDIQDIDSYLIFKKGTEVQDEFKTKAAVTDQIGTIFVSTTLGNARLKVTESATEFKVHIPALGTSVMVQ